MVRQYAVLDEPKDENGKVIKGDPSVPRKWIIRRARKKVLLRGTMRYCSVNVHKRLEQVGFLFDYRIQGFREAIWKYTTLCFDHKASFANFQGRVDDLYSWIFMLAEMRSPLPWAAAQREERLIALKEAFPLDANVNKCEAMRDILSYLPSVKYSDRPDYKFIYNCVSLFLQSWTSASVSCLSWWDLAGMAQDSTTKETVCFPNPIFEL